MVHTDKKQMQNTAVTQFPWLQVAQDLLQQWKHASHIVQQIVSLILSASRN
jgi:hypothetical protein